ncbi:MAG: 4Fe-4S binding protein [Limnochordaceae bacterium]|nr:4Fe-4S binding protein [Limnochordaceae bacterium]
MNKRVYAFEETCVGCRLCELACIQQHAGAADLLQAYAVPGELQASPRLHVEESLTTANSALAATSPASVPVVTEFTVAVTCHHCDEPLCLLSCLTGALYRDDHGIVQVDDAACVGCWTCVLACPWGAIRPSQRNSRPVSNKCDLCIDRPGGPACVAACPNGALAWADEPPREWRRLRQLFAEAQLSPDDSTGEAGEPGDESVAAKINSGPGDETVVTATPSGTGGKSLPAACSRAAVPGVSHVA